MVALLSPQSKIGATKSGINEFDSVSRSELMLERSSCGKWNVINSLLKTLSNLLVCG